MHLKRTDHALEVIRVDELGCSRILYVEHVPQGFISLLRLKSFIMSAQRVIILHAFRETHVLECSLDIESRTA